MRVLILVLVLAGCASTPTPQQCNQRADEQMKTLATGDVLTNIYIHDDLVRVCLGMPARGIVK